VVRAEHLAAALQGVLAQRAGRLDLAHLEQGEGQGNGRQQGDRVVRAERPAAASSLRSPSAPPPGPHLDRTIRSTSTLNIRPTSTLLTGGNASHGGTLSDACRLWGATQPPRTPPTSRAHPGLGRTQPPHDRDHGQQAVNR
jgi:hypothetical protein